MNNQVARVIHKFNIILSKQQKKRAFQLVVLMIIGGMLETASVSLVYPFISLIMEPDRFVDSKMGKLIVSLIPFDSSRELILIFSVLLALIFVLKNIYMLFQYNVQYRYVYSNMLHTQKKILSAFIHRPYEFYLGANSAELIRIIHSDTSSAFGMLVTLLSFASELIVSIMLIGTVFALAPVTTAIMAGVLLVLVVLVNFFLRPALKKCGCEYQSSSSGMYKWLLQSIEGIKELKVMRKESFFEKKYDEFGNRYVRSLRKSNILSVTPKYVIEATCMSTMFAVVSVFIVSGYQLDKIVPTLSTIALASLRLLPSANRLSSGLNSMSYNEPMLDKVLESLSVRKSLKNETDHYEDSSHSEITCFMKDIVFDSLSYQYPDSPVKVLENAELIISRGESVGIIGASGAGKTTTVDLLMGLLTPSSGRILLDGRDIYDNLPDFLKMVGYIPQNIFVLDDSIRNNVAFGEDSVDDEKVWRAIQDASLLEFVKSLPDGVDTQIGERGVRLSGGQKQRIGIARALYNNPEILIFDEATSSLDKETEKSIIESINSLMGLKTMIIIAHRLSTLEKCDHIYKVADGKIVLER